MPAEETLYLVPLQEVVAVTRRILEERRHGVCERENGTVLLTSAWSAST